MYELYAEDLGCHFIWRIKLPLLFNMVNHYTPHCLQRRVTVDYAESLKKKFCRTPSALKGTLAQKSTMYVEHC
jgi:hypothetical protein